MESLLGNAAFMAAVGTAFGALLLRFVDSWLGKVKERAATERSMRDELRVEINSLKEQLAKMAEEEARLEALVDDWKEKWYDLRDENTKIVTELTLALDRLKRFEVTLDPKGDD